MRRFMLIESLISVNLGLGRLRGVRDVSVFRLVVISGHCRRQPGITSCCARVCQWEVLS